jgi:hypothetical protein
MTAAKTLVLLAALLTATAAFAADPMSRKKGEAATFTGSSFGQLTTLLADDDVVTGTFDNDGKLSVKGSMSDPNYTGYWTASKAPTECESEKEGTSYWGKLTFAMSDAGRTYSGKWSYCDADPDRAFQAKWDGK